MTGSLTAYGHSWVAGEAATCQPRGFVEVAARRLGLTADNRGVGGSHSTDTAAVLSRQPPPASEIVVVMTGLNDARLQGLDPGALEAYATALETIFGVLTQSSPFALTITVEQPPLLDYSLHEPHNRGSNTVLDRYNQALRAVADRFPRVLCVGVDGWDATTMLDVDTVHPNDAGHARVADAVVLAASGWARD